MHVPASQPNLIRVVLMLLAGVALGVTIGCLMFGWMLHSAYGQTASPESAWLFVVLDAVAEIRDGH